MLIAEDLLLLLYDDESGRPSFDATKVDYSLAGAVLLELSMLGKVGVAGAGESVKEGRLVVSDATPSATTCSTARWPTCGTTRARSPRTCSGRCARGCATGCCSGWPTAG